MEYWVSRQSVKQGPLQDWDIREMITDGDLEETDLIWCQGQDEWQSLKELQLFQSTFEKLKEESEVTPVAPPPLPYQPFWVRRAFAKIFDYFLYYTIVFITCNLAGIRFGISSDLAWLELCKVVPFVLIELYLTKVYGWSAGKWLMDLKVISQNDEQISWKRAVNRTITVWFFGMAFGLQPVFFLSMLISYWISKGRDYASWEVMSQTKIMGQSEYRLSRLLLYIGLFLLLIAIMAVFPMLHPETAVEYQKQLQELWKQYPALKPPQQ